MKWLLTLLLCSTLQASPLQEKEIVQEIWSEFSSLVPMSYTCFDLGLTKEDLEVFESLHISQGMVYNQFGELALLKSECLQFLRDVCNNEEALIQAASEIIEKIVFNVSKASQKETAWISLRAYTPNEVYNTPRWHTDGSYYAPDYGAQYKFATTLKGPSTYFMPLDEEMRSLYEDHSDDRAFLAEVFQKDEAEQPRIGQGAIFVVGNSRFSALHSEPKIDSQRLFLSILPCHECEMKELKRRWNVPD